MDLIGNLAIGFESAVSVQFYALIGCVLGTLIGILPGLGPPMTLIRRAR